MTIESVESSDGAATAHREHLARGFGGEFTVVLETYISHATRISAEAGQRQYGCLRGLSCCGQSGGLG